jgi:hypothetical protein
VGSISLCPEDWMRHLTEPRRTNPAGVNCHGRSAMLRRYPLRAGSMEHATDKIHVIFLADDWEVESQSGVPLAHANDKCEAIDAAKKLAGQRGSKPSSCTMEMG